MKKQRTAIGQHACLEALSIHSNWVTQVQVRRGDEEKSPVSQLAKRKGLKIQSVSVGVLDRLGSHHQGVAVTMADRPELDLQSLGDDSLLLALDGISDPHNLGAILRTAWLMGVDGVILSIHGTVSLTPIVHKVACGGVEHVPILAVSKFSDVVPQLKDQGFWVYGLADSADKSLYDYRPAAKTLLIVGSEEKGLRSTTLKQCDEKLSIPQVSQGPSYNASVATALALAETQRQRTWSS